MHPSREHIEGLVFGTLAEEHAEQLADHIEQCPVCEETVREFEAKSDTYIEDLRKRIEPEPYTQESDCVRAIDLIEQIGREPSFGAQTLHDAKTPHPTVGELGQYVLMEKLGEGGMGAVYKALHRKLDKVVALKVLPAERIQDAAAVERFEREMKAVGNLEHSNIVRAMDAGEIDGMHYLVMELVDGVDLSSLVRRIGPLSAADACELVRQAAIGLAHAHNRGMVHRDIKPSNLMLAAREDGDPQVKILDMGLALLDEQQAAQQRDLTNTGQMMGTLDYMAPEQGTDVHNVDIRADIYALGASLFKLLVGQPPFPPAKYNTPLKLMMSKATEDSPSIAEQRADLPAELVAIIDRMLAREPDKRFATPDEVVAVLSPFTNGANLTSLLDKVAGSLHEPKVDQSENKTHEHLSAESHETAPTMDAAPQFTVDDSGSTGAASDEMPVHEETLAEPVARPSTAPARSRSMRRMIAIAASLAGIILLGVILTLTFKNGTVEISTPKGKLPDDLKVVLKGGGKAVEITAENKWAMSVSPDDYKVIVKGGDDSFEVKQDRVIVRRFGRTLLTIERNAALGHERPIATPKRLPPADSPLANLDPAHILPAERALWEAPDVKMPHAELVAVIGESRGGHTGPVDGVVFSPDGKTAASYSLTPSPGRHMHRGELCIWDVGSMQVKKRVFDLSEPCFVPGRNLLATHRSHRSPSGLVFFDVNPDELKERFRFPQDTSNQPGQVVGFSPDGQRVHVLNMAKNRVGAVVTWDIKTRKELKRIELGKFGSYGAIFSARRHVFGPDRVLFHTRIRSSTFKSVTADGYGEELSAWDLADGRQLWKRETTDWPVAFSPDGNRFLFRAKQALGEADTDTGKVLATFKATEGAMTGAYLPDGRQVLFQAESSLAILDLKTQSVRRFDKKLPRPILSIAVSADGRRVLSGDAGGSVRLWDIESGEELLPRKGHLGAMREGNFAFSGDGGTLATGGYDGTVRLWDLTGTKPDEKTLLPLFEIDAEPLGVALAPNRKTLAVSCGYWGRRRPKFNLGLWDLSKGTPILQLGESTRDTFMSDLRFSTDGKKLACVEQFGFTLLDIDSGKPAKKRKLAVEVSYPYGLGTYRSYGNTFTISPDCKYGALGISGDGVWVHELRPEKAIDKKVYAVSKGTFQAHAKIGTHPVVSAFSPDGQTFATVGLSPDWKGSSDWPAIVKLWDWNGGEPKLKKELSGIYYSANRVGFSPDGTIVYVFSYVKSFVQKTLGIERGPNAPQVVYWDAQTGEKLAEWHVPTDKYFPIFAPDGRHAAILSKYGSVSIFRLSGPLERGW